MKNLMVAAMLICFMSLQALANDIGFGGTTSSAITTEDATTGLSEADAETYNAATAFAPICYGQCQMNVTFGDGTTGWMVIECGGTKCGCWGSPAVSYWSQHGVVFNSVNANDCHK